MTAELISGETNVYSLKTTNNKYISWSSSNTLNLADSVSGNGQKWTITFSGNNAVIKNKGTTTRQIVWNAASTGLRFAAYNSPTIDDSKADGMHNVQLWKRPKTAAVGDAIAYLKSVIDYYRLKAETTVEGEGLSVCSAGNSIFGTSEWTKAKSVFASLTSSQRIELSVQDYFGETGKTYVDTYEWLIAKDPANQSSRNGLTGISSDNTSTIIIVISLLSVSAIGGFFFLRKRKEER